MIADVEPVHVHHGFTTISSIMIVCDEKSVRAQVGHITSNYDPGHYAKIAAHSYLIISNLTLLPI